MTATHRLDPDVSRRKFLGWVVASSTLVVAASLVDATEADGVLPSLPSPSDLLDLSDVLTDATLPTSLRVTVTVNVDGTVAYALPRAEVGQGLTTAVAMI